MRTGLTPPLAEVLESAAAVGFEVEACFQLAASERAEVGSRLDSEEDRRLAFEGPVYCGEGGDQGLALDRPLDALAVDLDIESFGMLITSL